MLRLKVAFSVCCQCPLQFGFAHKIQRSTNVSCSGWTDLSSGFIETLTNLKGPYANIWILFHIPMPTDNSMSLFQSFLLVSCNTFSHVSDPWSGVNHTLLGLRRLSFSSQTHQTIWVFVEDVAAQMFYTMLQVLFCLFYSTSSCFVRLAAAFPQTFPGELVPRLLPVVSLSQSFFIIVSSLFFTLFVQWFSFIHWYFDRSDRVCRFVFPYVSSRWGDCRVSSVCLLVLKVPSGIVKIPLLNRSCFFWTAGLFL